MDMLSSEKGLAMPLSCDMLEGGLMGEKVDLGLLPGDPITSLGGLFSLV